MKLYRLTTVYSASTRFQTRGVYKTMRTVASNVRVSKFVLFFPSFAMTKVDIPEPAYAFS